MIHESPEPSQQKPEIEIELPRKNLWRTLLSHGMNPMTHMREHKVVENVLLTDSLDSKEQREDEMKKRCQVTRILHIGDRLIKSLSSKHMLPFMKKEG